MKIKSPTLRRFLRRKTAVAAAVVLSVIILIALFGPLVCEALGLDPYTMDLLNKNKGSSAAHWFGTDSLGRDTLVRMIYGARISLALSFVGVVVGGMIGIILGVVAGYFGGIADTLISNFINILLAFPGLLLAITIVAILGTGTMNTAIALAISAIPGMCRIVRGSVISIKQSEYVQSCKVIGESDARIILTHILPNTISLIIVTLTLNLGGSILASSSLSFLGLGVQAPNPEWGAMLNEAKAYIRVAPQGVIIVGICIMIVVMSFSLLGDGLRDALDPKLKNTY